MSNIINIQLESHKLPEFKEVKNKDYIFFGDNNLYPKYLLELYSRSGKHNAIINAKKKYIAGKGFNEEVKANRYESLNDVLKKVALDYEIFGGYALQIIWSAGGKISEIYHIDFSKLRVNKDGQSYAYSKDWSKPRPEDQDDFKVIPVFNELNPTGSQVLYYKEYTPALKYYPLPEYIGCIPYCEIDYEISNFHLNNIKNGFWGGYMISFNNGTPEPEEQKAIAKKIQDKHTGSDNAGRFVLNFSDSKDKEPSLLNLQPSDLDKQFDILNKTVQQEIFTGHAVTSPMLMGVRVEGQLGGRSEMLDAYELFKKTYITPKQESIEFIFNKLVKLMGFSVELDIVELEPIAPQFTEQTLVSVMTKDEIRERAGLPPLVIAPEMRSQFDTQKVIGLFSEVGHSKSDYEVLRSRKTWFLSDEPRLISFYGKSLTEVEKRVLEVIKKDPKISVDGINKALKIKDGAEIIDGLINDSIIEPSTGGELTITSEGSDIINSNNPPEISIQVMYEYDGPQDDKNREFCAELLRLNKIFKREEIETISAKMGFDVWAQRGGFYHNPKTDVTTPYCRHTWNQVVVRKITQR